MRAIRDISGQRFGRLTAVRRIGKRSGLSAWLAKCDCGNETTVLLNNICRGLVRSCGCLQQESRTTHGHTDDRTYSTWRNMLTRCGNARSENCARYGGRGIRVCDRWHKFDAFLMDMGERPPGKTIDRIDPDKGHEPGNCRWATPKEQARNRRISRKEPSHGEATGIERL